MVPETDDSGSITMIIPCAIRLRGTTRNLSVQDSPDVATQGLIGMC